MKYLITSVFLLLTITPVTQAQAQEQEQQLDEKLTLFGKYLGNWEAVFESVDGKPSVVDVAHWERALNGKAIRTLHSINDGVYGGESLIFWDKEKQKVVFYYFTTADFYTQGYIEIVSDNSFIAYEDVTGNEDGITKVRSTSVLEKDKLTVSTAYFKNDEWTPSESRSYTRSNKKVIFK
ncbi:hypothetical protein [Thalassotalea sp. Y01]|uniref:hypothetical protein n=1 Tax=Thalassotalea sp. Y01 TaxID=2729613 RepID=UPI00145CE802|nr:hypothetical protein [Thalassotalea sp. Y01]NMP15045.1 hypothetical protein [Thalassotalea sp. Y01]